MLKHVSMYIYSITIDQACSALVITIDKVNMGGRPPLEKYIAMWGGRFFATFPPAGWPFPPYGGLF